MLWNQFEGLPIIILTPKNQFIIITWTGIKYVKLAVSNNNTLFTTKYNNIKSLLLFKI